MTRRAPDEQRLPVRQFVACWLGGALIASIGCMNPILRQQSPEARLDLPPTPDVPLISEYTHPYGLDYVKVEAISLVTGLAGTGSDPPPSPQRAELLDDMNRRGVENPNDVLESPDTALVLVRAYLRPGIQTGDHFDVEVRVPSRSDTTSLRGGWLLPARLTEMAVLGDQIRQGNVLGVAEGPVLVDPSADPKSNPALAVRGRVLGGGVALKSRSLGLVISQAAQVGPPEPSKWRSPSTMRFYVHVDGRKQGVAVPKTDEFIELAVHSRYKDNVGRYMRVVRSVPVNESAQVLQDRLQLLEHQLADPLTAANAAIRLEAIGSDQAIEILKRGAQDERPRGPLLRGRGAGLPGPNGGAWKRSPPWPATSRPSASMRWRRSSAMDDVIAYDALRGHCCRVPQRRNPLRRIPLPVGDERARSAGPRRKDGGQFTYHVLDVGGRPMVHVTNSYRPEIVLFGKDQHFQLPLVLDAGPEHPGQRAKRRQDHRQPLPRRPGTASSASFPPASTKWSARSSSSAAPIPTSSKPCSRRSTTARWQEPLPSSTRCPQPGRAVRPRMRPIDRRRTKAEHSVYRPARTRRSTSPRRCPTCSRNSARESRVESRESDPESTGICCNR